MANNTSHEFRQKVFIALIGILPGVLGLIIGDGVGYNRGQVSTQIETIERLDGMQNIQGDNVTINYYSVLNETVSEIETQKQEIEEQKREIERQKQEVDEYNNTIDELKEVKKNLEAEVQNLSIQVSGLKHQLETQEELIQPIGKKHWVSFDNSEYLGSITPSVWYAEAGTSVSVRLEPSEGYYLEGIDVLGNSINFYNISDSTEWYFIMPNSDASIHIRHK